MKQYIRAKTLDISEESVQDRVALARDPNTAVEILRQLANDSNISVRHALLTNPSTPVDILADAVANADDNTVWVLSHNKALPADLIRELVKSNITTSTAYYIAELPNTPSDVLNTLYIEFPYATIRKALAAHPNATSEIKDKYENYRQSIIEIRARVFDYVKKHLYDGLKDIIYDIETEHFDCQIVAEHIKGYDEDWCSGEYTAEAEAKWEDALNALTEYEVFQLFEDLEL